MIRNVGLHINHLNHFTSQTAGTPQVAVEKNRWAKHLGLSSNKDTYEGSLQVGLAGRHCPGHFI